MSNSIVYEPDKFSFTIDFQREIIVAGLQHPSFMIKLGNDINPLYFEIDSYSLIFAGIKKFFERYQEIPSKIAITNFIPNKVLTEEITELIEEIYNYRELKQGELKFILDNVMIFVQHQAMKKSIIESIQDLSEIEKYPKIKERIEEALSVGTNICDMGTVVYDEEEILNRHKSRLEHTDYLKIPIGFQKLDEVLDGGLAEGDLFTFLAPAKAGKSMFLVNVGAKALLEQKNVLHITLEMSEKRIIDRYDMRLLGLTKNELLVNSTIKKLKELQKNYLGKLVVKEVMPDAFTPDQLLTFIKKNQCVTGFFPDVVLVDYADIMAPSRRYSQKRFEIDNIYYGLKRISEELKIRLVTASQTNRDSIRRLENGELIDMADVAESFGIVRIATVAVSINCTPSDKRNHKAKLFVAASRYGEDGVAFNAYIDYSKCLTRDWTRDDGFIDNIGNGEEYE
jgi:replicative DNA helicase